MALTKSRKESTRVLAGLGLSENEATLYELMLTHPRSTVQELAVRTPFPRTLLYYVLKQLMQRGLVSAKETRRCTIYIAEDPHKLYELLAKKEHESTQERAAIRDLVPQLKQMYRLAGKRPTVRTFDGIAEYEKALDDCIISSPREVLSYQALGKRRTALETRESHEKRRVARKIPKKVLFFDGAFATAELKKIQYNDFTQFRRIEESTLTPFEADVTLYNGKIMYTSYADTEPTAVLVEDDSLFEMQESLFYSLWKHGKDRTLAFTEKI